VALERGSSSRLESRPSIFNVRATFVAGALWTSSRYGFVLEQNAQETESISLLNPGDVSHSATLAILNPHPDLDLSLQSQGPVTLAPRATETLSLDIDAAAAAVGVYDGILLKVAVDDGSTIYSNISVHVTEPGAPDLPDLSIDSEDIGLGGGDPGTLAATVRNRGTAPASTVAVDFYELDTLLGSVVIDSLPAAGSGTASIGIPPLSDGDHLIRVIVDPTDAIEEVDEGNNQASRIIRPAGASGPIEGNILVTGSLPATVYTDALFSLTGRAVYDITVDDVLHQLPGRRRRRGRDHPGRGRYRMGLRRHPHRCQRQLQQIAGRAVLSRHLSPVHDSDRQDLRRPPRAGLHPRRAPGRPSASASTAVSARIVPWRMGV